ncbi:hypothetical protein RUND412_004725 [Rhizina undulata]
MSTKIYVVIYNPTVDQDPSHWALWLLAPDNSSTILEVEDDKHGVGYYVAKPKYKDPARSAKLQNTILCGSVNAADGQLAFDTIQNQPADNVSNTWNCQSWVMEGLHALVDLGLMVIDDATWKQLEEKRQNLQ